MNTQNSIEIDESQTQMQMPLQIQTNPVNKNPRKEKFSASNSENSTNKKFLISSSNLNFTNSANSTNFLLQSSFGKSCLSVNHNENNISNIGKKFNNTENLINDKTSILVEKNENLKNLDNIQEKHENLGKYKFKDYPVSITDKNYFSTRNLNSHIENSLLSITESEFTERNEVVDKELINEMKSKNTIQHSYSNTSDLFSFDVDKKFLNFGILFPGELLSKSVKIKNLSSIKQLEIQIKFELQEKNFRIKNEIEEYQELNTILQNENFSTNSKCYEVENSLKKYRSCFYFSHVDELENLNNSGNNESHSHSQINSESNLNPTQTIKIFLKEKEEKEIFVNFKTPFIKKSEKIFALAKINIINYSKLQGNHTEGESNFILSHAVIEIPKLLCLKEIYSPIAKIPLITLSVEIKTKGQKFRIPFKNLSLKDIEIEFSLDKTKSHSLFTVDGCEFYECQFIFFPKSMWIGSQQISTLELIAKVKKVRKDENVEERKKSSQVRKVIIAKIKNVDVIYSFFVEVWLKTNSDV